eukprot:CAMPEP_0172303214 /NCGR_PEP_ID=MMETSP1058-20130122/4790_1 /TAXON_ID=83371 /ORGANISM="Detonula confervacea, Strain CCMP 353" /LENGTH=748 /DNA_ID=CAMNT_0013013955 /DNA_START=146 /DNA_END=2387 /DNA_ORIENTATION=+
MPIMNDTRLCGTHKLITLESAQYYIRLVAEFMRDEEEGKSVTTFARAFFDPLWQRLKDQGNGNGGGNKNNNSSYLGSSSRNSCGWRYEPSRDPLSIRNWAFVPPRSTLGAKGKLGKDLPSAVLEDISTMEEVSDLFTKNAHYFTAIIPILDRAVTENIEYKCARRREIDSGTSNSPNDRKSSTRSGRGSRSCNFQNFGVDCALMDDPYELSGDDESTVDENNDYCDTCGEGGELICCDNCDNAYHAKCLRVEPDNLPDPWHCPSCSNSGNGKKKSADNSTQQTKSLACDDRIESDSGNENSDECGVCGDGGELICCDGCIEAYHTTCLGVETDSLPYPWHCPSCISNSADGEKKMGSVSPQQSKGGPALDNTTFWDDGMNSNLSGVAPKLNMPIEIRDSDFVWNMSRITRISYDNDKCQNNSGNSSGLDGSPPKCHVTVRYEGWGPHWDETLRYPNERLARVFTYTKLVKCFVTLLGSKKNDIPNEGNAESAKNIRNWTDTWPCKVFFRMPHPNQSHASAFLQEENNVYVEPYMGHLLPQAVQHQITNGGQWVNESMLRPWKDLNVHDPVTSPTGHCIMYNMPSSGEQAEKAPALSPVGTAYHIIGDFCQAYQMAQSKIQGKLPPKVLLEGALLKHEYCVHNVGGDVIDGVRYSGSFTRGDGRDNNQDSIPASLFNSVTQSSLNLSNISASKVPFVPPPSLPQPIPITDMAYLNQGVRRLPGSNRWASTLRLAGSDIFLGSYASQSEA